MFRLLGNPFCETPFPLIWYDHLVPLPPAYYVQQSCHTKFVPQWKGFFEKKKVPLAHTLRKKRQHEKFSQNKTEVKRNVLDKRIYER